MSQMSISQYGYPDDGTYQTDSGDMSNPTTTAVDSAGPSSTSETSSSSTGSATKTDNPNVPQGALWRRRDGEGHFIRPTGSF
jgi:hypothetical protein